MKALAPRSPTWWALFYWACGRSSWPSGCGATVVESLLLAPSRRLRSRDPSQSLPSCFLTIHRVADNHDSRKSSFVLCSNLRTARTVGYTGLLHGVYGDGTFVQRAS